MQSNYADNPVPEIAHQQGSYSGDHLDSLGEHHIFPECMYWMRACTSLSVVAGEALQDRVLPRQRRDTDYSRSYRVIDLEGEEVRTPRLSVLCLRMSDRFL